MVTVPSLLLHMHTGDLRTPAQSRKSIPTAATGICSLNTLGCSEGRETPTYNNPIPCRTSWVVFIKHLCSLLFCLHGSLLVTVSRIWVNIFSYTIFFLNLTMPNQELKKCICITLSILFSANELIPKLHENECENCKINNHNLIISLCLLRGREEN